MEKSGVQRLGQVLGVLVTVVFVCNLLTLVLVPALVNLQSDGNSMWHLVDLASGALHAHSVWEILLRGLLLVVMSWRFLGEMSSYSLVLTFFLLFCGVCTAGLLWQAQRILKQICRRTPFCQENAVSMRRAAVCCFLIAAAALIRVVWSFFFFRTLQPLLTYNALFCPIFLLAGLLCMVMSALFQQAATLREENDLTI